jgi:surfeit locus 1 family protein
MIIGLSGTLVLASFGVWQVQRLAWKEGILAEIEGRIAGPLVALPAVPELDQHRFLPVEVMGDFDGTDVPVFLSHSGGPIYRLIAAFQTDDGRRIMVDRGGISAAQPLDDARRTAAMSGVTVTGNLHWPDEVDSWTPERDANGVYYGRDVLEMADELATEPVLVILREASENTPPATPLPVTTTGIPNNHLGYAVQWFGLAIVWAGMTLALLWRIRKRTV